MDFYISQKQFEQILTESDKNVLSESMKSLYSSVVNIVNKVQRKYGINLKMLLTWGPAVGGITAPLDNFLRNSTFDLSDGQIALLVCSAFFMAFFENRKQTSQLKNKIDDEGLTDIFEFVKEKAFRLKKAFAAFLKSAGIVINNLGEAIGYSFLIPIILDIQNLVQGEDDLKKVSVLILKRLVSSGVIMLSSETLFELLKKLSKKLSQ